MSALQPNKAAAGTKTTATPAPEPQAEIQNPAAVADFFDSITKIELESVVNSTKGPSLQRITFGPGTDPTSILPGLKALDPTAKVRTEFYSGKGGKRDNKTATVIDLSIKVNDYGGTIDLDALTTDGEDIIIAVWKNKTQDVKNEILALGRLSEANAEKIKTAFAEKKTVRVRLDEEEYFGANYWTNDKAEFCLDSLTAAPPAAATGPEPEPKKEA